MSVTDGGRFRLPAGSRTRRRQRDASGHDAHDGTSRPTDRSAPGHNSSGADEKPFTRSEGSLPPPAAEDIGPVTSTVLTALDGTITGINRRIAAYPTVRAAAVGWEPLTYSPVVAATATRLRRLFPAGRCPATG